MAWKRGTEQKQKPGQVSSFRLPLAVQSITAIDAADPKKGFRVRALAASDKINSGKIRIRASAWKVRKQGAPMLYEHGKDRRVGALALGRWDKFEVIEGTGLVAEGKVDYFEAPDPRAEVVADIQSGRLTDVSVGHSPAKLEIAKQGSTDFLDVQETTLGEISFVAVGMDEEAVYERMAASALGFEWEDGGAPPEQQQGGQMDRKLLIQLLNMSGHSLKDDANDAEIIAAVQSMGKSAMLGTKAADVLGALGLEQTADVQTVRTKVAELKNPANFVAKAEFDKLKEKTQAAEIDSLIAANKQIPAGQKEYAKELLALGHEPETQGRKLFDKWVHSLPSVSTRQIVQGDAGAPPRQSEQEQHMEQITAADSSWCQTIHYFSDERDDTGKVKLKAVDRMAQMAEVSSSEALSWLFGQSIPETEADKQQRLYRQQQHAE